MKDTSAASINELEVEPLNDYDNFYVMGCSLMVQNDFRNKIYKLSDMLAKKGTKISFDPNILKELLRDENIQDIVDPILKNCEVLLPGLEELLFITGTNKLNDALSKIFNDFPIKIVVLKLGKKGCKVITKEKEFSIKAYKIEEIDPTGAGDCFDAGFITGLIKGKSLEDSAKIAAAAGAINATGFGPMEGYVSKKKIKEFTGISI